MSERRLHTSTDLRRYLASVINRLESGDLEPAVAGKVGYLVSILQRIIETSDLEQRIEQLEAQSESTKKSR